MPSGTDGPFCPNSKTSDDEYNAHCSGFIFLDYETIVWHVCLLEGRYLVTNSIHCKAWENWVILSGKRFGFDFIMLWAPQIKRHSCPWSRDGRNLRGEYLKSITAGKKSPPFDCVSFCFFFPAGLGKEGWLAGGCHGWPRTASDRPRAHQGQTACQLGTEDSSSAGPESGRTYQDPKEKRAQAWQQGTYTSHTDMLHWVLLCSILQ